jgi:hypothetical protein
VWGNPPAVDQFDEDVKRSGVWCSNHDGTFDEMRSLPGRFADGAIVGQILRPVTDKVTGYQPAHGMGDDVELDVLLIDTVEPSVLFPDMGLLFQDNFVQAFCVLDVVVPPVVVELKTGEVAVALCHLAGQAQVLVAIIGLRSDL